MPQTLEPAAVATTLEGATQTIARRRVASLESIKNIGTNGGGFFNQNSAHPFENPTALTNALEIIFHAVDCSSIDLHIWQNNESPTTRMGIFWGICCFIHRVFSDHTSGGANW